jgi:hypothetical protein
MVISSHIRALLTLPLVAIAVSCFSSSAAQPHDRRATAPATAAVVDGRNDLPPVPRTTLALEVVASANEGRVTLRFTLPRAGIVRITLSTPDGREVGTLASGLSASGENRLDVDVRKIPEGQYLCTLQTRDGNASTRLVISK